jgi:branched-chain amino acid aminotransferase
MGRKKMELNITTKPENERGKLPEDESTLGFGTCFTDHMFSMYYTEERGWHGAEIMPYHNLVLDPAACSLHYGQMIFEGLKAYRREDGIWLFRPDKNMERLNASANRMCMVRIDPDFVINALKELITIDQRWVPHSEGTSLYIRPTFIATEPFLGVHPSTEYLFYVILCAVGAYYATGFAPVKIKVEDKYVRAALGGVGFAKAAGNYAASLKSAEEAAEEGYTQVLWLDAQERKYVEEVGTMNQFFVIDETVITSPLTGSILPGVTRDSVIQICKSEGISVEERNLSIEEVIKAIDDGKMDEAFGSGTAAVITPVGSLGYKGKEYTINDFKVGELTQRLYDTLTGIQWGKIEDKYGWTTKVC